MIAGRGMIRNAAGWPEMIDMTGLSLRSKQLRAKVSGRPC